jgi:hypothetical protein
MPPVVERRKPDTRQRKKAKQSKTAQSRPEIRSLEIFLAVSDASSMTGGAVIDRVHHIGGLPRSLG